MGGRGAVERERERERERELEAAHPFKKVSVWVTEEKALPAFQPPQRKKVCGGGPGGWLT